MNFGSPILRRSPLKTLVNRESHPAFLKAREEAVINFAVEHGECFFGEEQVEAFIFQRTTSERVNTGMTQFFAVGLGVAPFQDVPGNGIGV